MENQKEYSRYMSDFRGIDATSEASNVALNRFSFIQNMYKDYKSGQGVAIETFPGTRTLLSGLGADGKGEVRGIHPFKATSGETYVVVHAGRRLYYFKNSDRDINSEQDIKEKPAEFSGITMNNKRSSSFVYNNRLYIIDGQHYIEINSSKKAKRIVGAEEIKDGDENFKEAYIPTTFSDGAQYEQRNMLTDRFREKTHLLSLKKNNAPFPSFSETGICYSSSGVPTKGMWRIAYANEEYIDSIVNRVYMNFNCIVEDGYWEDEYGDSYEYYYAQYEPNGRKKIKSRTFSDNVIEISGNFDGCIYLKSLTLPDGVSTLEARFFAQTALEVIYLPRSLTSLGVEAFSGCSNLKKIYASDEKIIPSDNGMTSMYDILNASKNIYNIDSKVEIEPLGEAYDRIKESEVEEKENTKNRIYVYSSCKDILKVELDGKVIEPLSDGVSSGYSKIYKTIGGKTYIVAIDIYGEESNIPCDVYISGEAYPNDFSSAANAFIENRPLADFENNSIYANHEYSKSTKDAIKNCTIICTFDDRIFFTGNPDLPNTVFYTQRDLTGNTNPTYIGALNWFDDGVGVEPNTAMMANSTTLMVLKGNTMQDGSIFYHVGADGGNDLTPRIYPSTEGLTGLGCVGLAVNFRDDCVFMSNQGLEAVAKQTVNLERTIEHRSTNIDGLLLQADLTKAKAAEWEGYLCILIDGKMYLADSRQMFQGVGGAMEYEWYYVDPVCGYDGDNEKYYLADYMPEEIQELIDNGQISIEISDSEDRSVDYKEVHGGDMCNCHNNVDASYTYTIEDEDGNEKTYPIYYVERDGVKYLVDSDGERENGTPDKAVEICAIGDVLLFGTESGKLLCLNTDKRGTDDNEPDKSRIPMKYYNNSGHAYDAVAVLAMENAGVPHFTKSTVKRGTVLRLKSFPRSAFEIYATTDRTATTLLSKQSNSITTFDELDFANIGLLTTDSSILAIKEKTKKWVEKQYMLIGREYNKPWGLYSLAYRYIIAGGVKNQ